jgi:hypothetical protein
MIQFRVTSSREKRPSGEDRVSLGAPNSLKTPAAISARHAASVCNYARARIHRGNKMLEHLSLSPQRTGSIPQRERPRVTISDADSRVKGHGVPSTIPSGRLLVLSRLVPRLTVGVFLQRRPGTRGDRCSVGDINAGMSRARRSVRLVDQRLPFACN